MLLLALLLSVSCLISSEATCPDGKTTCPEGQVCCTVNDKQSCCDEGQRPLRSALQAPTVSNSSVLNALSGPCSTLFNCNGTCCNSGYSCCYAYTLATCCSGGGCCDFMSTCCNGGWCCPSYGKCCSTPGWGSYPNRWCCKRTQRCGQVFNTCYAGAGALSPTTLVTLVAAWLVAYALKKM